MASKRSGPRSSPPPTHAVTASAPLANLALLGAAVSYGIGVLVSNGRVSWPPHQLLASIYTVAGCLALVGPLVLARADSGERGLGDLLWMTAGLLIWTFDAAAAIRGRWQSQAWATPLAPETMGLIVLAVLLAGWRCRLGSRSWSWTNVTGWVLGLYWVGMTVASMLPDRVVAGGSR